jgi:hypothetical protein
MEELHFAPSNKPHRVVDLYVGKKLIAFFYWAEAPVSLDSVTFEVDRGHSGEWLDLKKGGLVDPRLSGWHKAVLEAWLAGESRADVEQ